MVPIVTATFHPRKVAVFLCAAAALTAFAGAKRPPDAAEILRRAEEIRSPQRDYAVDFTLEATWASSSWKQRRAAYTLIARGKDQSLVLMRDPPQFYPGLLLIDHGAYWLLLPRSDLPHQLSAHHVLNGDVSNGDLARGNLLATYAPRLDGEEPVGGVSCWRLELERTDPRALYPRIRAWIDQKTFRPIQFEYHGQTGALLKTARYGDYRNGPLGIRAMRIEVESHVRVGEWTTLTFENLRPIDTRALDFSRDGLRDLREAARAWLERTGVQARPENLTRAPRTGSP